MNPNPQQKFVHDEYLTAVYQINDADQTVSYAFAFAHPKDVANRKIGRNVARGRLEKGGINKQGKPRSYTVSLADATEGSTKYTDISKFIMHHASVIELQGGAMRGDRVSIHTLELMNLLSQGKISETDFAMALNRLPLAEAAGAL